MCRAISAIKIMNKNSLAIYEKGVHICGCLFLIIPSLYAILSTVIYETLGLQCSLGLMRKVMAIISDIELFL